MRENKFTVFSQVVRDRDLFGILGGLVLVDVTLLVTWLVLHPPSRRVVIIEEGTRVRLTLNYLIEWTYREL